MPKITVIMPSLNVVKFIKPCMDSVCGQTLQDMEILFIDAGSTDGTLEIVQTYAKKDPRIRIIKADRKSYGYQLNLGIAEATGEYVGVVETDDIIFLDMFETLYHIAEESKADYVKGMAEAFSEIPVCGESSFPIWIFEQKQYEKHQGMISVVPKETPELVLLDTYLWNGIYRRDFIKKIHLNETSKAAYQDIGFMVQVHTLARSAIYLAKKVYRYRRDNLNSSCYNKNAFHYLVQEYAYVDQLLQGKEEKWRKVCYYKMFRQLNIRFQTMAESGEFWEEAWEDISVLTNRLKNAVDDRVLGKSELTEKEWEALECLVKDPMALYNTYKKTVDEKANSVEEIVKKIRNQKVVIFGSGKCGKFLYVLIEKRLPGNVIMFCDNQEALWGKEIQGIPILPPQQAVKEYPDAIYLIAGKLYEHEMREQLRRLCIKEEHIVTYAWGVDMTLLRLI